MRWSVLVFISFYTILVSSKDENDKNLLILTVATEETDGFRRFVRSATRFDLNVQVLYKSMTIFENVTSTANYRSSVWATNGQGETLNDLRVADKKFVCYAMLYNNFIKQDQI